MSMRNVSKRAKKSKIISTNFIIYYAYYACQTEKLCFFAGFFAFEKIYFQTFIYKPSHYI